MPGKSSAFSPSILFGQVQKIIDLGRKRSLESDDLPELPTAIDPRVEKFVFRELNLQSSGSFLRSIMGEVKGSIWTMALFMGVCGLLSQATPIVIHALVEAAEKSSRNQTGLWYGLALGAVLCFLNVAEAIAFQHYVYRALTTSQKIVNGLNELIYRHALVLTRLARLKSPTGEVVNYIGTDTDTVAESSWIWIEVVHSLFMLTLGTISLFHYLGPAALCALFVILLMVPATRTIGKKLTQIGDEVMDQRDNRVSLMAQILSGIRIVKFFNWESRVEKDILNIRSQEISSRLRLARLRALSVLVFVASSVVVSVSTFSLYQALGHTLDAPTVFSSLALFAILEGPLGNLGGFIAELAAARVSAERIRSFLLAETLPASDRPLSPAGQPFGVSFQQTDIQYGDGSGPALRDVSMVVSPGESVAIVGPVGGGKTTLLLGILGEVPVSRGAIDILGIGEGERPRWAFVPQEAFTLNSTLRENMAFGSDSTDQAIAEAICFCALDQDIRNLSHGINTEIGEHGVNLSGGQKQRIALARAHLYRPGMVLLDDPLAAVDEHTEDFLVEKLLFGAWKPLTRVVVTHRLKHLEKFDRIVFLQNGRIHGVGTFKTLVGESPTFAAFIAGANHTVPNHDVRTQGTLIDRQEESSSEGNGRITDEEDRERGSVDRRLYIQYLKGIGGKSPRKRAFVLTALGAFMALVSLLPMAQSSWLAFWMSGETSKSSQYGSFYGILVFALLGLLIILTSYAQNIWWAYRSIEAGRELHDSALKAVLKAQTRFFDATPVGRILNRFSRDIDSIEKSLPQALEGAIRCVIALLGTAVLLLALVPGIILIVIPVMWWFSGFQKDYRASAREAQRISSIARSPRFAHFKETLGGLSVIRAYHQERRFLDKHRVSLAAYQRAFHGMVAINRWFSTRVPIATAFISLGSACGILISARLGIVTVGAVGLALTYATRFWGNLNWAVRCFSDLESRMTAVERVRSYQQIPAEPDITDPQESSLEDEWPRSGRVQFEGVTARYAPHLPDVLRDVTFDIEAASKVGIIGRTGSGKSTVFQVLFRFIEPRLGRVLIDGIDVRQIPLSRLRRAIAIIPQDPTLFRGTIRDNLDRFDECSDEQIWDALAQIYLKDFVASLPNGLRAEVAENGHNFSQGQRQLFCLARAILVNARVVVMDEATASVDVETDALIQKAIHRSMAGRTVIIIAHRLVTIGDCKQIIVLDQGVARIVRSSRDDNRSGVVEDGEVNCLAPLVES
jgi:ABC-type multidrug transport system fused ATPase/permease subunit